jgi:hypothetical protein
MNGSACSAVSAVQPSFPEADEAALEPIHAPLDVVSAK